MKAMRATLLGILLLPPAVFGQAPQDPPAPKAVGPTIRVFPKGAAAPLSLDELNARERQYKIALESADRAANEPPRLGDPPPDPGRRTFPYMFLWILILVLAVLALVAARVAYSRKRAVASGPQLPAEKS